MVLSISSIPSFTEKELRLVLPLSLDRLKFSFRCTLGSGNRLRSGDREIETSERKTKRVVLKK